MSATAIEPLAVWDSREPGDCFWRHHLEASEWASTHLPGRAASIYRAEFYLMDAPFAVVHAYARNDQDRIIFDPATNGPVHAPPATVILGELPPEHLWR
jgi:hypothetical protein